MSRPAGLQQPAPAPLRRAHRALWVLTVISILAAGGLSAAASAPPSPAAALSFALSAVFLGAGTILAARVVIALERARRAGRPPSAPLAADFPVMARLLGARPSASRDQTADRDVAAGAGTARRPRASRPSTF